MSPAMGAPVKDLLCAAAEKQGFDLCRVARAGPAPHAGALREWLQDGNQGGMEWMARTAAQRSDPALLLPGVRSVVVFRHELPDRRSPDTGIDGARGRIARYARGRDYHEVLKPRLDALAEVLAEAGGEQRCCIDGARCSNATGRRHAAFHGMERAPWASIRAWAHGFFSR